MIIICEPQCKNFSHEKANSGFIYGLSLAFPLEKMRFYADITHIQAIKNILSHDGVIINNIEYKPIKFENLLNPIGILNYYFLFKRILLDMLFDNNEKIFFLSFNPIILLILKKLKQNHRFLHIKFTFVLHGEFENINDGVSQNMAFSLPEAKITHRIRDIKITQIPNKLMKYLYFLIKNYWKKTIISLYKFFFPLKKILFWRHSGDLKYIVLSSHIAVNAEKYIDVDVLNFHMVNLPTIFAPELPHPKNQFPKFAVFGYGDSSMLYQILIRLSKRNIKHKYEIRVIGMDSRGTEGFDNVTTPAQGSPLSRIMMEKYAEDIDIFMILYTKDKYRLSCSGSILEAISYMKPVLHFDNDCINSFNKIKHPIGICSGDIDGYVDEMVNIIDNYSLFIEKSKVFRENIATLRKELSIENSILNIKNSFTWQ